MNYWIFKANPDKYRIDDRLKDPDPITTWQTNQYRQEIQPGDIAFIWKTGPDRGICGVIEVTSYPQYTDEIETERRYSIDLDPGPLPRVYGKFLYRSPFISHKELRDVPGLENLSVFHGYQMKTNFHVNKTEGKILMSYFKVG